MFNLSSDEWEYIGRLGFIEHGTSKNLAAEGLYYGGEKMVFDKLKPDQYLPFNVNEVIEAGINCLKKQIIRLLNAQQVANKIRASLEENKGYSVIRLGDGELMFLTHDILLPTKEINNDPRFNFLSYAGVTLPNHPIRDSLTKCIQQANVVGIPQARYPTFQCLFNKIAKFSKWNLANMSLASSNINYEMNNYTTLFHVLLSNYRVLLVGNRMKEGRLFFEKQGYKNIVGDIQVDGIMDVPNVLDKTSQFDFDVAFVSAGVPANLICVGLAEKGKIAIDFGHLIDQLIGGGLPILSLEKCSSQPDLCCRIGEYFYTRNDFETAALWYSMAVDADQKFGLRSDYSTWFPHLQLCLCYWNLGLPKKSYEHNEKAAQFIPNDPSVLFNRKFFGEQIIE